DYDSFGHTGWSVLVRGRSRFIDDPREVDRLSRLWLSAWGNPVTDRWIAIAMEHVSGRRIHHGMGAGDPAPPVRSDGTRTGASAGFPVVATELLAWRSWGTVRADLHTTTAEARVVTPRSSV